MSKYYIGVDLGGTNVRSSVVTEDGKILGGGKVPSKAMEGLDATVEQLLLSVKLALESAGKDISEVAGVGMSVPGTHKSKEGIVVWSPNFKDWNGVNLAGPIREALGVPVYKLLGGKTNDKLRAYASQLQFGWRTLIEEKDNLTLL